ncbi:DNA replication ATP-dependent helicase/nuclease DNA2, partial [Armadillidium nasatum]
LFLQKTCSPSDHTAWVSRLISCKLEDSVLLVDTLNGAPEERDCSGQIINVKETKVIYTILRCFLKMGIPSNEIGIITPYRAQVKYMKENMPSETNNCDSCIEVNTVDQYQGRDKSVILYSCVRSGLREENIKKGEILNDIRRLNVAVTRAKTKLIILGCLETLRLFEPFEKLINSIKRDQIYELKENVDDFSWKSF